MNATSALLLCGHGSRDLAALAEFRQLVHAIRDSLPEQLVEYGYLELAAPTIWETLEKLHQRGIHDVTAIPVMLMAAGHVKHDLPKIFNSFRSHHEDVTVRFGRELGLDAHVIDASTERIRKVMGGADAVPGESVLVVVGRGASEPNIIADVARLAALLRERLGFAAAVTCYCGIAEPLVEAGLREAAEFGHQTVVVFPLLLFTGVLERRVYECVERMKLLYPQIRFLEAEYLNNHPSLIAAFVQRFRECKMESTVTEPVAGTM